MTHLDKAELNRLGKNIRRLRNVRGMNQTALAYKANTRPTTISMIENGLNTNPGWDLLDRICSALDTTIHKLTLPPSTSMTDETGEIIPPPGLVTLMREEDRLLGPTEERLTLQEVAWMKLGPLKTPEAWGAEDFLQLLRQFRFLNGSRCLD